MNYLTFFFSVKSSKCSAYFTLRAHLHSDQPPFQVLNNAHGAGSTVAGTGQGTRPHVLRLGGTQSNTEREKKRYKANNKHT